MNNNAAANNTDDLFAQLGLDFTNLPEAAPATKKTEPVTKNPPGTVLTLNNSIKVDDVNIGDKAPAGNVDNVLSGKTAQEIATLAASGINKLHNIETEINSIFVEREQVIKDLLRALIVGQHMLLLGPPGTAKIDILA